MSTSKPLATDKEVLDVMKSGGLEICERAYFKHYRNEYDLSPEAQEQNKARWKYIEHRISELCSEMKAASKAA